MSDDIVIVFIFFAGPIRGYLPGRRVNNFYSHGRRGNSHLDCENQACDHVLETPSHFLLSWKLVKARVDG